MSTQHQLFKESESNFGIFIPADICRNSDGTPKQAKPEYAAGPAVTVTITKDNFNQ